MSYIPKILLILIACGSIAFAQKSKVTSGSMAYNNGDFEEALRLLNEALEKPEMLENKDKAKAYFKKGQSLKGILMKGDASLLMKFPNAPFDALEAFRESAKYDDLKLFEKERESEMLMMTNIFYQMGFGLFQMAAKKANQPDTFPILMEQSVRYLRVANELQPDNMGILSLLGSALHYNKDDKGAQPLLEKSISLYENRKDKTVKDKGMISTYMDLANIYLYTNKDNEKASALLQKAKAEYPDSKDFDVMELNFYLSGDNIEEGIRKFEKAIADNPNSEEIHIAYASLLEKKGDIEGAVKVYQKVLNFAPKSFNSNYNLGAMFMNKGIDLKKQADETEDYSKIEGLSRQAEEYFGRALPYMETAHSIDQKDVMTITGLIQLYTQLNKMDKASEFTKLRNSLQGK